MLEIHPLPAWASSATGHRATGLGFIGYPPPCHPLPATGHRLPAWASSVTRHRATRYPLPATGYRLPCRPLPATVPPATGHRAARYPLPATGHRAMCVRPRVKSEGEGYAHAKPG